jgi:hypothetical protein
MQRYIYKKKKKKFQQEIIKRIENKKEKLVQFCYILGVLERAP